MKSGWMRWMVRTAGFALVLVSFPAAAELKIGFVNTDRIFRDAAPAVRAQKKLEKEYLGKFGELNKLWKDIDHGKVKEIDGKYLQRAVELASDIVERMNKLLPKEYRVEKKRK